MSTKRVSFSDEVKELQHDILEQYSQDEVTWEETAERLGVKKKRLKKATLKVQDFIRNHVRELQYFNEERCRLMEELENIKLMKEEGLERVKEFLEDMKREAKLEAAEEEMDVDLDETKKREIKELEAENTELKRNSEELKASNKKLALDTFAIYERFEASVADVKGMEFEKKRLLEVKEKFEEALAAFEDLLKTVHKDTKKEKKQRKRLEKCIDGAIGAIEEGYKKNKLADKLWELKESMIQAEFLANMPMQC